MAASSNVATPITACRNYKTGAGTAPGRHMAEAATQTFLQGTPVQINALGFVQACATINSAASAVIAGFATSPGANLASAGVAQTQNLTQKVPNQPSAVITPIGAPPNDGTTEFTPPPDDQTFVGVLGNSVTAANAVSAQNQIGTLMGLTKDGGNSFWYVDNNITTTAGGACVVIVSLIDPVGTLNGRVEFKVTHAAQQLFQ